MKRIKSEFSNHRWLCIIVLLCIPLLGMSQNNNTVILKLKDASIREVFSEIKKQINVGFMYSNAAVNELSCKNYDFTDVPVENVIKYCLEGSDLTYEFDGTHTIIIKRKAALLSVKGKVVDINGEPLMGVAVYEKDNARNGTFTNMDGVFEFSSNKQSSMPVIVSFIGMERQEIIWKGKNLHILMEDKTQNIDEVVITGYQVINKRALTSAVQSVKAADIMRCDVTSIDQMLEGHIPDMIFMTNSGEAGVVPKIRIRGTSSLIGNREPLWVVDGIVVQDPVSVSPEELNDPDYVNRIGNAIAGLNPQDIERLDILKDASATAIYGTKAANGVIVITTKRGRIGKPEIRYTNSFNYKLRPRYSDRSVDLMNSKERIQFSRELYESRYEYNNNIPMVGYEGLLNDLYKGKINEKDFASGVQRLETMNTDWFDLLTKDSFSQSHSISMNGGSERGRYYASVGYNNTDDVIKSNKNERYTALLNLDTNFTEWLTASFGMNGSVNKREYYQSSLSPMDYAYTASRTLSAYDENGNYDYYEKLITNYEGYNYNILNELENSSVNQNNSSFNVDLNLKFRFNSWLTGNAIGSYTVQNTDINSYWGDKTFYAASLRKSEYGVTADNTSVMPQGGELTTNNINQNSYVLRFQLDWNKYFGNNENHGFSGGVGYEMGSTRYKGDTRTSRGYYPDRGKTFVSDINITEFPAYGNWLAGNIPYLVDDLANYISGYATATYSYNHMLYLNANARVDGSNRFGDKSNKRFLPIWSASGSFNFSELEFMRNIMWIDYLTAKASYGYQGNMIDSQSPVMIIRKNPLNAYYNEFTASAERNPNPNLRWERTNSTNFGLELSLFYNRLQVEGSLFHKYTEDAFMTKTISTVNGMSSYVVNGGNISNNGYSVSLTANPVMSKNWRWSFSTSFSRVINRIRTNPDGEQYELDDFLNGSAIVKGESIGTFYSYKFIGLSPLDGGPLFDDYEDHYDELIGLSKYETFKKVLEASGSREPFMSGGFTTNLRYKNLRLNATFAYSLGAKTRLFPMFGKGATNSGSSIAKTGDIRPEWNISRDYINRWKNPGDELHTNIPAIIGEGHPSYFKYINHWSPAIKNTSGEKLVQTFATSYWDMYNYSNVRVVSADYLKCSNISLTYELPQKLLSPYHINRLELTASAGNLFTICDPELKGQTPNQGGFTTIQLSDRPSFSLGLSVTF